MKNEKIFEITKEIIKSLKTIIDMSEEDKKKISWILLEELWFDYLEETINNERK